MQSKSCRSICLALVCCLFVSWALGSALPPARRQEAPVASTATNTPSSTSSLQASITTLPPTGATGSLNASSATASVTTTDGLFNITIPQGELPVEPRITPAWGVAGVILLGTGAVYALIGIKITGLHTFFSTAFLSALGTCVLIVYVMVPPISDGIQGAYLVAVVLTGAVLGGLAMVFKEITECLGCLLGGICLSMWLLTLREGGLLTSMGTKGGFVAAIALGSFAFYFSKWTRHHALIASTSFSGATVVVLGIDTFSRAGLKEFWAYIWALNDRLFPLGTVTYPLTRGIRVEIAITIVIFLAGIVSQHKLWLVIKQHREKQEAERLEARRKLDEEEARVGRQIEESAAADRRNWEAVYGDGQYQEERTGSPTDSPGGSLKNEKGVATDVQVSAMSDSAVRSTAMESTELAEMDTQDEKRPAKRLQDKSMSNLTLVHPDESTNPEPAVIPLPFNTPLPKEGEIEEDDDVASSVAAYAGDEDEQGVDCASNKGSMSRGNSHTPVFVVRTLSQQSGRESLAVPKENAKSRELLLTKPAMCEDQQSSVAATLDGNSTEEKEDETIDGKSANSSEAVATLANEPSATDVVMTSEPTMVAVTIFAPGNEKEIRLDEAASTGIPEADPLRASQDSQNNKFPSPEPEAETETAHAANLDATIKAPESTKKAGLADEFLPQAMSKIVMSHRTNEWAKHLSLAETPVLETLDFEEVDMDEAAEPEPKAGEQPVPVNTEELQQTANNAALPLAIGRPSSTLSHYQQQPTTPQQLVFPSQSRLSWHPDTQFRDGASTPGAEQMYRRTPAISRPSVTNIGPIVEEAKGLRPMPTTTPPPVLEAKALRRQSASPVPSGSATALNRQAVPGVVSYSNPQTLIGQRDVLVRRKSIFGSMQSGLMESLPITRSPNPGEAAPLANHTQYAPSPSPSPSPYAAYPDDIPMSKRRELMMRQQSLLSLSGNETMHSPYNMPQRSQSRASFGNLPYLNTGLGAAASADALAFDSHQPRRSTIAPSQEVRESQLAYFRNSLAAEMRAGPLIGGRQSPALKNISGAEIDNSNVELHRGIMLGQRDAELQKRDLENVERARAEQVFDEMMRRGDMQDAHRSILRKMQASAKDA